MNARNRARNLLQLATVAVGACTSASHSNPFPVGSYDSDAYTLAFDSSGTFRYLMGDKLMVQGEYIVHDSTISLTDEKGGDACHGADRNPGTYHWASVDSSLWFHTVRDSCPDRVRGLADQPWKPH
jgi:hypothetical protein